MELIWSLQVCAVLAAVTLANGGKYLSLLIAEWFNVGRSVAESNNTHATEGIPVVSIPVDFVSSAHFAVKRI